MRVLLPFPVEKTTVINFMWALKDEDELIEEECNLFVRNVIFYRNDSQPIDFCPELGQTNVEAYQKIRLIQCETFAKQID